MTDKKATKERKKTDDWADVLIKRLKSNTDGLIDDLTSPTTLQLFQEHGYEINGWLRHFKTHGKDTPHPLEVDLLLIGDEIAIIVEVKTNCTRRDIDHFTDQMAFFKEVCPEYADKTILLAVAAINYDRDAKQHALQEGLLAITASDNDIFSLECPEESRLKKL